MPSSIIEVPCTRRAKTLRAGHMPAGTESVSWSSKASKGCPAATCPRRGMSAVASGYHCSAQACMFASCLPASGVYEGKAKVNSLLLRLSAGAPAVATRLFAAEALAEGAADLLLQLR